MNALFGNLTTDGLEEAEDRIGGFQPLDTDIYIGTIKTAYAGQSQGGAHNVTLLVDIGGREYRETIYITNRKGENFFLNKNDKTKKVPLPGFTTIDDICLIATGAPLAEQPTEDKTANVYDPEAKKELPKSVPMLMDLLGQEVALGIVRQTENKSTKVGSEYVPTSETRDVNFIDKVFHPTEHVTVVEAKRDAELVAEGKEAIGAGFWESWMDRNQGKTRDKTVDVDEGTQGRPGQAPQGGGTKSPAKSLFGKKAA